MKSPFATQLEFLIAQTEIRAVLERWSRAVDRCDWDGMRLLFHSDAIYDHGVYRGDIEGMIAWLDSRRLFASRSAHVMGSVVTEFVDKDNALSESYLIALQRQTTDGKTYTDALMTGRYLDHMQHRNGEWRISQRTTVLDNAIRISVPADAPSFATDFTVSTRDGSDPLWAMREKLGIR